MSMLKWRENISKMVFYLIKVMEKFFLTILRNEKSSLNTTKITVKINPKLQLNPFILVIFTYKNESLII
jgi:hypothetical protein|tara:strand:- start:283 stop:489 length:207 start_codon:yes stop_codon:yes gene_type:complete